MKKEITNKKTIEYLEKILSERAHVYHPMKINIPDFGEVTVTSMVDYHVSEDGIVPYFTFKTDGETGKFFERNGQYFVKIEPGIW